VLPDVNADDGDEVGAEVRDGVLVIGLTIGKDIRALVVHEPSPAGALDSGRSLVESCAELVHAAPALDERVVKGTALGEVTVGLWAEGVPEERMVDVTSAVEVERLLQRYELLDVAGGEGFGLLLHQFVEVCDVRSVMSAVVEVNDLTAHDGFERSHLPWQVLELDAV